MRNISLGLYRHSKHAYNYMAKIFAMPTEPELIKWGVQSDSSTAADAVSGNDDVPANNVALIEAEALVDEVAFENLMGVII